MRFKTLAVAAAGIALCGCYRVTVLTSAAPAATVVDKPWQMSFVDGLIPPPELNTREQCPNGASKVVVEHSFLNGLASGITWGIVSPIHVTVTCAAR